MFLQGEIQEALKLLEKGVQSFQAIAAVLTLPGQLGVLAEAYTKAGRLAQAHEALDLRLALAKSTTTALMRLSYIVLRASLSCWSQAISPPLRTASVSPSRQPAANKAEHGSFAPQ